MKLFRSDILENLWMALGTLRANKLRSFLTVIGVIIGVVTVMLIASIISGIDTAFTKEVESFGTRSMYISKYNPGIHVGRLSREERMRKPLTYDDAIALGKLPDFEKAGTQTVSEGRFFSQFENDQNQNVCVIGSKVADDFFPFIPPLDETIKI